ncbi:MAG: methionyl-tRNA formyltransferase [Sulfuritalea sp.]|nr:methionyl-tRNA formyltransferase [Sulfuritalea sp.]
MKLVFAGTPDFAASALEAILAAGHEVVLVLTQPDRPAGRGMSLQASAVKKLALSHGIPVYQPERLKDPATHEPIRAACLEHAAELMVVAAYGLILPQAVLDLPSKGCINIHASLLPRWRGAAPIHRAIEAGDTQTGITIMQMDAGLDTGPMLLAEATEIAADDTTGSLHDRLATLGGKLVVDALARFDQLIPTTQPETGVTYANKIDKTEAKLGWEQPAAVLARKIRAFNPFPGAVIPLAGEQIKAWRAEVVSGNGRPGQVLAADAKGIVVACGEGVLCITELQKPGARRVTSADFLHGSSLKPD